MKTILVTGAAGIVGGAVRAGLAERHEHLRLTDLRPVPDLRANESFHAGDLTDAAFLQKVCQGVDGIVHLGGRVGAEYTFEEVLGPNIIGTHNVLEAARANGVRRIVYASSAHCVGFTPRGRHIDHHAPPRPNGEYAVSKGFGELAASHHVDKFDLNALCIRIGYVGRELDKERRVRTWISARDLVQLIEIGLQKDVGFEIVYGVSDNPDSFFDNSNATRLGYRPQDRADAAVTDREVLNAPPDLKTIEGGVVGGGFAAAGFAGDVGKVLSRK